MATIHITTEKLYRENPLNVCTGSMPPESEPVFITPDQLHEVIDSVKDGFSEKFYVLQKEDEKRTTCNQSVKSNYA